MSSHFKLYDGMGEVIPFNARYSYPTQANRAWKSLIKIPPKNGSSFRSDQSTAPIRIEFPAQGYLNCANSSLVFDITLDVPRGTRNARFQNNIQSIFKRVRLVYGSLPLEDIREYNVIVRMLTEGASTNSTHTMDQTAIAEGIGGSIVVPTSQVVQGKTLNNDVSVWTPHPVAVNTRLLNVQSGGFSQPFWFPDGNPNGIDSLAPVKAGDLDGPLLDAANGQVKAITADADGVPRSRRYQVQLALGLFQQGKLLPLKWMASQLTLELELESYANCVADCSGTTSVPTVGPGLYTISNIAYLAELLEFDGSYDAAFLEGLRGEGVPIKFATWDTFPNNPSGSSRQTYLVPERNRSLKAAFCVQLPTPGTAHTAATYLPVDSHAFLHSSANADEPDTTPTKIKWTSQLGLRKGWLKNFQWRIGGKYYPAQPVDCGSMLPNGAAEAYFEFAKALNIVGDYRLSTGIHPNRWSRPNGGSGSNAHWSSCIDWDTDRPLDAANVQGHSHAAWYHDGPSAFVVAADFETSAGGEVSGLNGEEQNDIALMLEYSEPQDPTCPCPIFVYYDALLVLRENNLVELIK